jgi:hypothetical protein
MKMAFLSVGNRENSTDTQLSKAPIQIAKRNEIDHCNLTEVIYEGDISGCT